MLAAGRGRHPLAVVPSAPTFLMMAGPVSGNASISGNAICLALGNVPLFLAVPLHFSVFAAARCRRHCIPPPRLSPLLLLLQRGAWVRSNRQRRASADRRSHSPASSRSSRSSPSSPTARSSRRPAGQGPAVLLLASASQPALPAAAAPSARSHRGCRRRRVARGAPRNATAASSAADARSRAAIYLASRRQRWGRARRRRRRPVDGVGDVSARSIILTAHRYWARRTASTLVSSRAR